VPIRRTPQGMANAREFTYDSSVTRLAWITPDYPPERGGVSDHSHAMVGAYRAQGYQVLVCSKPHLRGFEQLDAELAAFRPEVVVLAYVPLGYGPRTGGIAPALTYWCVGLRKRLEASTLLLAHEVALPVAAHWRRRELKLALLGAAQLVQFEVLARAFGSVAFSNERTRDAWAAHMPTRRDRLHTVRICSNIPFIPSPAPGAALAALGRSVPVRTILFFGTGHDSVLFDYVEAALVELLKIEPQVRLVIVGIDAEKLRRLRPSLSDFGERVQPLGFVAAEEVSLWLQTAELVLAPLIEGVNARKGSIMAALQHGRAVITTRGIHTRGDIPWARICALSPLEREAFAELAVRYFRSPCMRERLGGEARADYEAHASASVTAAQLLGYTANSQFNA